MEEQLIQSEQPEQEVQAPVRKKEKKAGSVWKWVLLLVSVLVLSAGIAYGVTLSSRLNQGESSLRKAQFVFPERKGEMPEAENVAQLQDSKYESIADIAEDVGRSVVTVVTTVAAQDPYGIMGDTYYGEALGSGVIIGEKDDELYIATNYHVIADATDVNILIGKDDTKAVTAHYKGSDSQSDLAVIYVKKSEMDQETLDSIKIATLGESDELKIGDLAIAIGSPVDKSYSNTVTCGIISGLERSVTFQDETTGLSNTLVLLQTDAAINPGNSGGALVNGKGEVIGINDAKIVSDDIEGMGFAIPMSSAKETLQSLINNGKVVRPYLGITGATLTAGSEFASQYGLLSGVYVQTVVEGLAADKAGMKPGDVVISFNGKKVEKFSDMTDELYACEIGQTVEVEVIRGYEAGNAETVTLKITIQEKPGDFDK